MIADDAKVREAAKNLPSKSLATVHKFLTKGALTLSTGADKALDLFLNALVLRVWEPPQGSGDFNEEQLMIAAMGEKLEEVNTDSCRGRREGDRCVFLQFGGLSNETVGHGTCCRGVCETSACPELSASEAAAEREFSVKNVSLVNLRRQSKSCRSRLG